MKYNGRIPPKIRREVLARSHGLCEAHLKGCTGRGEHLHHKRTRSQGGKHTVENLINACGWCHRYIHDHPGEAYELGLMLRSGNGR